MDRKKIFISWSKSQSKRVAISLKQYLAEILENVELFVSEKDIGPGERSMKVIEQELDGTSYGIAVVTQENQAEPWLNFEAGALSKAVGNDEQGIPHVVPILVDIENASELTGPISQFQAVRLDHDGLQEIIKSICAITAADQDVACRRFERAWAEMEKELAEARQKGVSLRKPERTLDDKVDETLQILRTIQRSVPLVEDYPFAHRDAYERGRADALFQRNSEAADQLAIKFGGTVFDAHRNERGDLSEIFAIGSPEFPLARFRDELAKLVGRRVKVNFRAIEDADSQIERLQAWRSTSEDSE